ncbi:MAG: hypothetical protein JSW14_00010 [Candidatus Bathyarchaeum sp.]|nr:MAG: hypothetical protein JSW14_00010 [Candidatus Bathyarchaeum sp.]
MSAIQLLGAGGFGALLGWYVYYLNRYRKDDRKLGDLVTLIGILGGGSILALFPASTDLFGAYGIGLCCGFFGYFTFLNIYVRISENFSIDWFLDGRRKKPKDPWQIPDQQMPTIGPMGQQEDSEEEDTNVINP